MGLRPLKDGNCIVGWKLSRHCIIILLEKIFYAYPVRPTFVYNHCAVFSCHKFLQRKLFLLSDLLVDNGGDCCRSFCSLSFLGWTSPYPSASPHRASAPDLTIPTAFQFINVSLNSEEPKLDTILLMWHNKCWLNAQFSTLSILAWFANLARVCFTTYCYWWSEER